MSLKKDKTISQLTIKHMIYFFVIIFLSINACLQIESHITDKVDSLFNNYNNSISPGAAIGIYKDGEVYYINGYGMADLEHNVPINEKTVLTKKLFSL